ncbi:nucleotide exchange factor GrpE [candidate division KSB1 bacterium]|nr:nucleotide exchange factor GrpE [candidate division KSB1 bacterium]
MQEKERETLETEGENQQEENLVEGQEKIEEENDILKRENEALRDKFMRLAAEFDNFKKRADREKQELIKYSNEDLVTALLPVIDDFERFLAASQENSDDSLLEGIEMVYKNLVKILEEQGVKKMVSLGRDFDPEKHEALMTAKVSDVESNKVVEEHLAGYYYKDKVVRHAKVVVSE